jgi:mannose/cellobiose epimerase-like protein (N-acyl-D-glucosamine 2-epimerase family)
MPLQELRAEMHRQLFEEILPFWDRYGIDEEHGGIMCALDYDGTRAHDEKVLWFQGRGLWVYSFLYNHFGGNRRFLNIAAGIHGFLFRHAQQEDGWWAEVLTREGAVLRPFSGDLEGVFFVAEGLQEYAAATGDAGAAATATDLLKKLFGVFSRPEFRYRGADFRYLWNSERAVRPQGLWFLTLNVATQMLKRWPDEELEAMADAAVDAILHRHYNPEIGLNTEVMYGDFTRPPEEEKKVRFGHCVEALWMLMDEADRRGDRALWATCAERIRRHLDAGWDHVYGGLIQWVNVDHGCYEWPPETPPGTDLVLHFQGEYEYMKALWGLNESMVAMLKVLERTPAAWAAEYFDASYRVAQEKFSQRARGFPAGYMGFADRRMTPQAHVNRQDNYHVPRQLMLNLLSLDRMMGSGAK